MLPSALQKALDDLGQVEILRVVDDLGIRLNRKLRGECPLEHGSHYRNHFAVYPAKNRYVCHSCKDWGGPVDLWRLTTGDGFRKTVSAMARRYLNRRIDYRIPKEQIHLDIKLHGIGLQYVDMIWGMKNESLIYMPQKYKNMLERGELSEAKYYQLIDFYEHYREEAFAQIDEECHNESNKLNRQIDECWERLNECKSK